MPENTYTIKVETQDAEKNVDALLSKVQELLAALGQLAQASQGGLLGNPAAVQNLQAVSNAQAGGGGAGGGVVNASVQAARPQTGATGAPGVATTGTASGTTNPTASVQAPAAAPPSGIPPPAGTQQTGTPRGTAGAGGPTQAQAAAGGFDWTTSQFARTGAGFIAGQAVVSQATGWMGISTQETIAGGYNLQGRSRQTGEGLGTIAGAALGFALGGPAGAFIGGAFGGQLMGGLAEWSTAPRAASLAAQSAMMPSARVIGTPAGGTFTGMRDWIYAGSGNSPLHNIGLSTLSGAWSAIAGGMMQGGLDPRTSMPGLERGPIPYPNIWAGGGASLVAATARLGAATIRAGANWMSNIVRNPEPLSVRLTRILGAQYGSEAMPEIAKEQSGILGAATDTGQNPADILSRFGVMPTSRYYRMMGGLSATTEPGMANAAGAIPFEALFNANLGAATARRAGRLGAYAMRGSGEAVYGALGAEMGAYAGLPGGADSEAYAGAASRQRSAQMEMYGQQDIVNYGIPATKLGAQRGVLNALPYAPGYRFGVELQSIALSKQQIGTIQGRLNKGNLTEEQELSLQQQLAGLQVSVAGSISALTEGLENRMPALSAGRPSRFSRMDSSSLAALQLGRMGHPGREFGATGGKQLAAQDAFVNDILGPGGASMIGPMGRETPVGSSRVEALLERIAQILAQNAGAGQGPRTRVGEAVNKGQAVATGNPTPTYGGGSYN